MKTAAQAKTFSEDIKSLRLCCSVCSLLIQKSQTVQHQNKEEENVRYDRVATIAAAAAAAARRG